jgi:hypothetical protein
MQVIASGRRDSAGGMSSEMRECREATHRSRHGDVSDEGLTADDGRLEPSAFALKEPLEEIAALLGHQTTHYLRTMIEFGISKQIVDRPRHAVAVVIGTEDHAPNLRKHDGARTLGAGLQSDVQASHQQPIFTDILKGALQRKQLRMGGRISPLDGFIVRLSYDLTF